MQPPVVFVTGKPQHGKTTVRHLVAQITGLRGASCSDVVYHYLAARRQVSVEALRQLPKEELRPFLVEAGDFLCGANQPPQEVPVNKEVDAEVYRIPSALIRALFLSGINVIDGVRRRLELQDAKNHLEWNGVRALTLYVDRPGVPDIPDNTEDLRDLADEVILNDGTLAELEKTVEAVLKRYFAPTPPPAEEKVAVGA